MRPGAATGVSSGLQAARLLDSKAEVDAVADEGYQPFPDISAWTAAPFDPMTYEQYAALLAQARTAATEEAREYAVRTAIRYAGTDTGAIEGLYTTDRGFTRTVAVEAAHWEAAANERGPHAAEIIKDQIEAYEWVLDLVTQQRPVTEHIVRELHAMLCRSQATFVVHTDLGPQERDLPKGEYKKHPNNPTSLATGRLHYYAPPAMVAPEMRRLVDSLAAPDYVAAHPVVQAAYLHYTLAAIHPFADGNGRVARALASVPLYRAARVPLLVFRDERDEYLDSLERADAGHLDAFITFVQDRVIDTIGLVSHTTRLGPVSSRERSIEALRRAAVELGDITADDLRAAAARLLGLVEEAAKEQTARLPLPPPVRIEIERRDYVSTPFRPPDYVEVDGEVEVRVQSGPFAGAASRTRITARVAEAHAIAAVVLFAGREAVPLLEFQLREVVPTIREVARIKLDAWVETVVDEALAAAASRAGGQSAV